MLAVPMGAEGVEVRPIRQITGEREFNEVFLDEVEVPVEHVIGAENEGWSVANTTLGNERGGSFIWKEQVRHELAVDQLWAACAAAGRLADPLVRQRLARCRIDAELFRLHNARTLATLRLDAPTIAGVDELRWRGPAPEFEAIAAWLGQPSLFTRAQAHAARLPPA